jgi:4,5-dihydroxyphthalate decarboxylase
MGRRSACSCNTMTAAVWIREGCCSRQGWTWGVSSWVEGAVEHPGTHGKPTVLPPRKPVKISQNANPQQSISDLLVDGEIVATIGADLPTSFGKSPHVRRLFPDFQGHGEESTTKIMAFFPIMHLAVVRRELYEKYPFVASSLYEALDKVKKHSASEDEVAQRAEVHDAVAAGGVG